MKLRAPAAIVTAGLMLVALVLLAYGRGPAFRLRLDGDPRAPAEGFYRAERLGPQHWVWTAPRAELAVADIDRRVAWHWTGRILMLRPEPVTLRVSVDGFVAAEQVVFENHQVVEVVIPTRPGARGLTLAFETTPGFAPGNGDPRVLGIAFESIELVPRGGRVWPRTGALLWGLLVTGVAGAALAISGVRPAVLYVGLTIVVLAQAWWLGRPGIIYGPYPVGTVAYPVGCWFAAVAVLRTYDWLPGAWSRWRARRARRPGTTVFTATGDTVQTWLDRPVLRRAYVLGACLLLIGFYAHALTFWGRGIIDKEAVAFVLNYWADRPLLATIFDPRLNDWGAYQARELSYLFDFVDARVFGVLLSNGVLLFVPLSGVAGLTALMGLYLWGSTRILGLDRVSAVLFAALFVSCFVTQSSVAILYRSSKMALSVSLLASLFLVTTLLRPRQDTRGTPVWSVLGVFALGVTMSLCDRQGYFLSAALTGIVGLLWVTSRLRREPATGHHVAVVLAGICAFGVSTLYNHVVAPAIVLWLNGYAPSFEYQQLPLAAASQLWFVRHAWALVGMQSSHFFGNAPFWTVAVLAVVGWMATNWASRASGRTRSTVRALLTDDVLMVTLAGTASLLVLFSAMVLRHPAVYAIPDHRLWYYWTPMHVAILFGATLWITSGRASGRAPGRRMGLALIHVLVLLMMAGNVAHYGEHRSVMISSARWFKHQYERTSRLVRVFETGSADGAAAEGKFLQDVREAVARVSAGRD